VGASRSFPGFLRGLRILEPVALCRSSLTRYTGPIFPEDIAYITELATPPAQAWFLRFFPPEAMTEGNVWVGRGSG
jgi:hypothetical protein